MTEFLIVMICLFALWSGAMLYLAHVLAGG